MFWFWSPNTACEMLKLLSLAIRVFDLTLQTVALVLKTNSLSLKQRYVIFTTNCMLKAGRGVRSRDPKRKISSHLSLKYHIRSQPITQCFSWTLKQAWSPAALGVSQTATHPEGFLGWPGEGAVEVDGSCTFFIRCTLFARLEYHKLKRNAFKIKPG